MYDLNQRCGTTDCCRQFRISVSLASRAKHKCLGHYCQCAQRTTHRVRYNREIDTLLNFGRRHMICFVVVVHTKLLLSFVLFMLCVLGIAVAAAAADYAMRKNKRFLSTWKSAYHPLNVNTFVSRSMQSNNDCCLSISRLRSDQLNKLDRIQWF